MVMYALLGCNPHAMWLKQCNDEWSELGIYFEEETHSQCVPFCRLVLLTHQHIHFGLHFRLFLSRSHGIACFRLQETSVKTATSWSTADQALP